jgi:serine/threonine-protein kinase
MGIVYRARHALLRRPTAIKVLAAAQVGPLALDRFEREVQLTAKLSHPNIVSVYDFGRTQDGTFYYAMEFLDGVDLQTLVDASGPQPPGRVQRILRQACHALAEAHAVHLIHRDIKPANMILTQRASEADVLKLVDFGLVKEVAADSALSEATQHTPGTPLYMSPEAIATPESVGPASDLYALGAVGYFLLTGAPVFDGKAVFAVLGQHMHAVPVAPSARARGVPPQLEAVILRCLAKLPEERFADAATLCAALEACDDVPPWTPADAFAWWRERQEPAASRRETRTLLTVDLQARAGHS